MVKILTFLVIIFILCMLWALPLWLAVNFVCLVFHITFNFTLLHSLAICLLISVVCNLIFKNKGDDKYV